MSILDFTVVKLLCSIWTYLVIVAITPIFFVAALITKIVLYPFDKNLYYSGRIFRNAGVTTIKLNPLWKFSVYGKIPERWPTRTVCVSNHLSWADTALISMLPWEMKWLTKASMMLLPFIGWSMWLVGDVAVHRGEKQSAKQAMAACRKWLDSGANIMIFPEGTRSANGVMGEFKDGCFRLAIETQCDMLPMAIVGTGEAIGKGSWTMSRAKAFVGVGKPISTKGMTLDDMDKLKATVRSKIQELIDEMKPHTKL